MKKKFFFIFLTLYKVLSNTESRNQGEMLKHLLDRSPSKFSENLKFNIFLFFLSSILNPTLQYFQDSLVLNWRNRITKKIHKEYYDEMTYYKVAFLDHRIKNPDQCITEDVESYW